MMSKEHEEPNQQCNPSKPLNNLYLALQKQVGGTLGDGVKTYMNYHFVEDGYQGLNLDNPNYHTLLELFVTLETFLGTLKLCLKTFDQHKDYIIEQRGEAHVNLCFKVFWAKYDEFRKQQNENRDRREIDKLLARAKDDLNSDSDEGYNI